jgi:hypothetical protein
MLFGKSLAQTVSTGNQIALCGRIFPDKANGKTNTDLPARCVMSGWMQRPFVALGLLALGMAIIPLGTLPLPTVISIFFVSPLLITLLSVPLLGERIGIHWVLSVCMGLGWVLLIIRPGTEQFRIESVIVFGAALSCALFQFWTRRLKGAGSLSAMVTVQQISHVAASLPVLAVNFVWPRPESGNVSPDFLLRAPMMPTGQDMLFLGFCTLAVLFLSVASSNAYRSVEASIIAPF